MGKTRRCFVVVLSHLDSGRKASQKKLALSHHTESVAAYRRAAMAAAIQVAEVFRQASPGIELLAVDLDSTVSRDLPPSPYAWQSLRALLESDGWWLNARGRLTGTLDGAKLASQVRRDARGTIADDDALIVVTNHELMPPPGHRYVLWDRGVLSVSQLDPYVADESVEQRFELLKTRLRASLCRLVGDIAGLHSCDNPVCFMQADVTSVAHVDEMQVFGPEHAAEGLRT